MKRTASLAFALLFSAIPLFGQQINPAALGFTPLLTNSTTLTVGQECSAVAVCNVRVDNTVYSLSTTATAVLSTTTNSGTVIFYIDKSGNAQALQNVTSTGGQFTCTNCNPTYTSSTPVFPSMSFPIASVTVTSGAYTSLSDKRSGAAIASYTNGSGIDSASSSGITTLSLDPNPAVSTLTLNGATSGSSVLSASATGGTLNLGSTNATVTSAGALTVTSCTGCGGSVGTLFAATIAVGVNASTTSYFSISGDSSSASSASNRAAPVAVGCTAVNMYVTISGTQPSSGSLVTTLYDQTSAAGTTLDVNIPLSSTAGTYPSSGSATLTAGHAYTLQIQNNATSTSPTIVGVGFQCH